MITAPKAVRVRLAPSPTGPFHLGNARTGLFNWLFARQHNGVFILRIEDTDKERSKKEYEDAILESLKWLGLKWDEGPAPQSSKLKAKSYVGDYGPYRQSERLDIYRKYLEKLLKEERAYYCYCPKEKLEAERQALLAEGLPPKYGGHCRNIQKPAPDEKPQLIRFKTPETKIEFKDLIRGKVSFDAALFGDLPIARIEETDRAGEMVRQAHKYEFIPLYNFAAVIDDEEMKISHVIRGEDHISNTPKQILFQKALGFETPAYAHIPLILAPDRSKLSSRQAATSVLAYRDMGYLPEAMVNFMGLLGWHSKAEKEIFTLDELVKEFGLERVQKAGAVFNIEKLNWLNNQHIKELSSDELIKRLKPFLKEKGIEASKEFLKKVVAAERERLKTLKEFLSLADFFFKLPDYDANLLVWKNEPVAKIKIILEQALDILKNLKVADFRKQKLSDSLSGLINEQGRGAVLWPLRVAVSGKAASPDPLVIMEILGKSETNSRLSLAVSKIESLIV